MADKENRDKELLELIAKQPVDPTVLNKDISFVGRPEMVTPESGGMVGFIDPKKPKEVNVLLPQSMKPQGLAHEIEHVTGEKAKKYGKDRTAMFKDNLADIYGPQSAWDNAETFRKQMGKNPALDDHIRKTYKVNPAYLFKQDTTLEEYISDLSSIEQMSGKDITKDPVIFKQVFFNDPKLAEAYRSVTGYRTERFDARDLPPFTMQPYLMQKPSITQQSISKLKGLFGI